MVTARVRSWKVATAVAVAAICLSLYSSIVAASADADVAILGLGHMGSAIANCLATSTKHKVHAWNRSPRNDVSSSYTLHPTPQQAVRASSSSRITIICIDDWLGTEHLIQHTLADDPTVWNDRTLIVFSTYVPSDIQWLETELKKKLASAESNVTLVGGAIVGVPATICSEQALILTSKKTDASGDVLLSTMGKSVILPNDDVGSASLVNIALVLAITFGIAGHELAHLMLQQYEASSSRSELIGIYSNLAAEFAPLFHSMLLPAVSQSMMVSPGTREAKPYVPAPVLASLLRKISNYATASLDIADDTFLPAYLKYLELVRETTSKGPAAWTEYATKTNQDEGGATNRLDEL